MANWLTSAAKAFQQPPPQPQTYELRCGCGRTLGGTRSASYQQIVCPGCERRLFVLSASVYPMPKSRPTSKPKPIPRAEIEPEAEEADVTDEEIQTTQPTPPQRTDGPRRSKSARTPPKAEPQPKPLRTPRKPWFTPLRAVLVGTTLVVLLTTWWVFHSRAVQIANAEYLAAARRAREALENRDLVAAHDALTTAHNALAVSGRSDGPARATEQLYDEVHAALNLVERSPSELLAEAALTRSNSLEEGWKQVFQYSYRDSWLILDVPVARRDAAAGREKFRIDYPVSTEKDRAVFIANLPIFDALVDSSEPRRVIFAAQIDDFRLDPQTSGAWEIVLKPETAFLWSNLPNYQLVGLTGDVPDEETRKVLAEQTERIGLPPWEAPAATPPVTAAVTSVVLEGR